jgi:hypothetical protein
MKTLISIVSKDERFSIPAESLAAFSEKFPDSRVEETKNNSERITVVHNRSIERALTEGYDFLVLMHADVDVDLGKLMSHIEECSSKYDVMGLCGCEKISVSESPLNWFCGSRLYPEFRWGCVCHGELGNAVSFFSGGRPETTDHAVSCIDGLCMILTRRAMEKGLRFDENLRFNCYDTQLSLDAVMKLRLRLGVLVETELKHFSVGRSILGEDFLKDELVLRKRFGFDIPGGSRLEALVASGRIKV